MRLILALGFTLSMAVAAAAQPADPIAARQALMKQNGRDTKAAVGFAKGETPYDATAATAIFERMNAVAGKFGGLFPPGSEKGGDTEASPAIWSKPADFKAAVAKFAKDTAAAAAARPATVEAFGVQLKAVTANCQSCHESFRVKKG